MHIEISQQKNRGQVSASDYPRDLSPKKGDRHMAKERTIACPLFFILIAFLLNGCSTTDPYIGQGPHPQVQRGRSIPPLDITASCLAFLSKLVLWNGKFANHKISKESEAELVQFIDERNTQGYPAFKEAVFRLNEYAPMGDLKALFKNHQVAWPYKVLFGFTTTIIYDVLLPGRIFPWGDYYNPFTNTAHIYSGESVIGMHEAGHAYDFARVRHKGTYVFIGMLNFANLGQEMAATDTVINYAIQIRNRDLEYRAYKVLYPAYGTYVGSYVPLPFNSVIGAIGGHIAAHFKVKKRKKVYAEMDAVQKRSSNADLFV